ncbi:MAG: hypothetical protein ACPGQS_15355 [Bradymonadia bacterium]
MRIISWFIAPGVDSFFATALYFLANFLLSFALILEIGILRVGVGKIDRPSNRVMVSMLSLAGGTVLLSWDGVGHEVAQMLRLLGAGAFGLWFGRRVVSATFIWPLVAVASAMDVGSILVTDSFTNAVVESVSADPNLIHPLMVYTPPGALFMPMFGLADIAFSMILVGAVARLELSKVRLRLGVLIGCMLGVMSVMSLQVPIPLLPFLGFGAAFALGKEAKTTLNEVLAVLKFLLVIAALLMLTRMI